ncbi:MAG: beta-propeller domain-containing protein [Deltaproteobacteria bacterium]|nr:beta-propeller domain-containing protein [Deltaproteobacteria bacterium]
MKKIYVLCSLIFTLNACGGSSPEPSQSQSTALQPGTVLETQLTSFRGEEELKSYLLSSTDRIRHLNPPTPSQPPNPGTDSAMAPAQGSVSPTSSGENSNITNNQESGVDEGDIVKNYRDFIITLHQGKLYTAQIASNHQLHKTGESAVKADGLSDSVWYDELLMKDNLAIVIGYRYSLTSDYSSDGGFTEINFFRIENDGAFTRQNTFFLKSSDYYSRQNYSGRQVGNKLVFYMSYYYQNIMSTSGEPQYPKYYRYIGNGNSETVGTLLSSADIYKPLQDTLYPYLHSIVVCDLEAAPNLSCKGRAVIGEYQHQYYVSENRAYLWVNSEEIREVPSSSNLGGVVPEMPTPNLTYRYPVSRDEAYLYALDLNSNGSGVVKTRGTPLSQFAFSEKNNTLSVFASEQEQSSPCSSDDGNHGNLWVQFNLSDFQTSAQEVSSNHYQCLPGRTANLVRFQENYLAYNLNNSLKLVQRETGVITNLDLASQSISRIELAGKDLMVIGANTETRNNNFILSLVQLDTPNPQVSSSYDLSGVNEAESRSHAYFYHEDKNFRSFAIATHKSAEGPYPTTVFWQGNSAAQLSFFNIVDEKIQTAGVFSVQSSLNNENTCTTSCIDWYGNTRPIFLEDQVLGLMGDQLVIGFQDSAGNIQDSQHLSISSGNTVND